MRASSGMRVDKRAIISQDSDVCENGVAAAATRLMERSATLRTEATPMAWWIIPVNSPGNTLVRWTASGVFQMVWIGKISLRDPCDCSRPP